jgi:methionyl-tRNA formyltransferase
LRPQLATLGARLLLSVLDQIETITPRPQPSEGVTYAKKITRDEGRIDWRKPAIEIERQVRALDCWFEVTGERIKLVAAALSEGPFDKSSGGAPGTVLDAAPTIACGDGALRLLRLQRAGRGVVDGAAFVRGFPLPPGTVLPCPATS